VLLSWRIGFRRVPESETSTADVALIVINIIAAPPGIRRSRLYISTEKTPHLHHLFRPLSYRLRTDMKRAFVLHLTPEARPVDGTFLGRVEEVDSGRNVKFGTIEEFLNFLQRCLDHQQTADG
jgi:hypothetical protein